MKTYYPVLHQHFYRCTFYLMIDDILVVLLLSSETLTDWYYFFKCVKSHTLTGVGGNTDVMFDRAVSEEVIKIISTHFPNSDTQ